jgi:RND family efflux transporter MFP subunit
VLNVFSSGTASGYSYKLSGVESGTYTASVDQAVALGMCGLRIIFAANSPSYQNSTWTIEIPNTKSSSYVTNLNAYNLAVTQAKTAIETAEQELILAKANASNDNAPARTEVVARANADVAQAEAMIARIDANLADRTLRAPFDGTITELDILKGETVTTAPILTILAASQFEVTARVPEIDIGQLAIGQRALMRFDARDEESVEGTITFISLKSTEIDGVAYFEALITFDTVPEWMRSGLNADIEIVVGEAIDVLKVPKRFVMEGANGPVVRTLAGEVVASSTIEILFTGNDGYVAVSGLNQGDTIVAP